MNDYYKKLPKKRMGTGVLVFNEKNEFLVVKPNYKDHWSIPGGVVDENESPRDACIREVKEEVGIGLAEVKFLCVDYTQANGEKNESLQFIFYGGELNTEQESKIKIDGNEIGEYRFVNAEEVIKLFGGPTRSLSKRLLQCLKAIEENTAIYLENGE